MWTLYTPTRLYMCDMYVLRDVYTNLKASNVAGQESLSSHDQFDGSSSAPVFTYVQDSAPPIVISPSGLFPYYLRERILKVGRKTWFVGE